MAGALTEEGVAKAKALIMDLEQMDIRSRRVTMKMDVSYTDHSHIIGKGGNTIQRVMSETGCHIHFPDSNRSNPNEKSNQVSIAGREMAGVEKARARVRELTPLIFCFDLPIISSLESTTDPNDPFLRAIQDQYNVQLMFRQKQKNFHTTMALVKGCDWEAARVKEATLILIDHLCGPNAGQPSTPLATSGTIPATGSSLASAQFPVSMTMEISPIHHRTVLGKNNINLKIVMNRTKTTILFPDAGDPNIPPIRKGSVTISGTIHNVYSARQQLMGSLPLVMMFDMPDNIEIVDSEVHKVGEELDVAISIKPKRNQTTRSVLIRAQERDASLIYAARYRLLRLEDEEEALVQADIPESYKVQPISPQLLQWLSCSNNNLPKTPPPLLLPNAMSAYSPLVPNPAFLAAAGGSASAAGQQSPFSPYMLAAQANPWSGAALAAQAAQAQNSPFNNLLTPNHPYLQDYAWLVLDNITRMQQQQQLLEQQQHLQQHQGPAFQMPQIKKNDDEDSNNNFDGGNFLNAKNGLHSPPIEGTSPRNSSPSHERGNLTNNLSKLDLHASPEKLLQQMCLSDNMNGHCVSSSSGLGTSATSGGTGSSGPNLSTSGHMAPPHAQPDHVVVGGGRTNNNNNSSSSSAGSSGDDQQLAGNFGHLFLDRRAPGCEMKTWKLAQQQLDYDQKKLLATKAMQNKPAGEPRTPTPSWSGLGFSSSMPENVIKEKLAAEEVASKERVNLSRCNLGILDETEAEDVNGKKSPLAADLDDVFKTPDGWFGNSSALDTMLYSGKMLHHTANTCSATGTGSGSVGHVTGSANNNSASSGLCGPPSAILPTDDLPTLLAKEGLGKYTDLFVRHEVDMQTFASLTEVDLKEIGVQTFGARKKLLMLATKIKHAINEKW